MTSKTDENRIKNQTHKLLNFEPKTPCPFCDGKNTAKSGQRLKKEGIAQKYFCKTCKKYFSSSPMPHKTYSPRVILNGITYYNLAVIIAPQFPHLIKPVKANLCFFGLGLPSLPSSLCTRSYSSSVSIGS